MAATTTTIDKDTSKEIAQTVTGATTNGSSTGGLGTATGGAGAGKVLNVSPTAQSSSAAASAPLPGSTNPDNSVSGRVDAILASDSPLMRRAGAEGMQAANRRGLGNSSMSVQASQAAILNAATPIASQEAQQQASAELAAADASNRERLQQAQLDAAAADTQARIAADERAKMLAALTDLTGQRFNALSNILANHKVSSGARSSAISSFNDQYQSTLNYLQNLYGVSLSNRTPAG